MFMETVHVFCKEFEFKTKQFIRYLIFSRAYLLYFSTNIYILFTNVMVYYKLNNYIFVNSF